MDWAKSKNVLIIAFLITNLILGGLVISKKMDITPTLSDDFIREVKKMLDEKNIRLSTEIPKDEIGLEPLTVRYESLDLENIRTSLYDSRAVVEKLANEDIIYDEKSKTSIKNAKLLVYENLDPSQVYDYMDLDLAKKLGQDFINQLGYFREDMKLTYSEKIGNKCYLSYSKIYEDRLVEKAYINISLGTRGVETFERIWLDIKGKGDIKIYTNTAPKAILSLLSMEEAYGKDIIDIDLVYYFDPQQHNYIESFENAKEGKTVPAWRVLFRDGTRIIIDDY